MELLTAFVSACQNVKFSSVCIVLLGVILFQSVRQRIAQSGMSVRRKESTATDQLEYAVSDSQYRFFAYQSERKPIIND